MSSYLITIILLVPIFGHIHPQHHHSHYHTVDDASINVRETYGVQPPQDQCKLVNATEPPQCPMTIGPPCPPCYSNVQPDYKTGDILNFTASEKATMRDFIDYYTNWWAENYPPFKAAPGGFDIYSGSAGRGYIFLRLYAYMGNQTYLNLASEYVDYAISQLPTKQYYSAFMSSHMGVWTLKAIIEYAQGNINVYEQYLGLINKTVLNVVDALQKGLNTSADGINMTLLDMETGLTGLVYNSVFINFLMQTNVISPEAIANITFYVMDQSIETGQMLGTDYLQIPFTYLAGCYLYGVNHGPTGLIHQFRYAYHIYPDALDALFSNVKYYNALKNTLDFYVSIQLQDGNMPTQIDGTCYENYGNDSDARVQFCHGAPGFINVFMDAAYFFHKYNKTAAQIYFQTAYSTANVTWNRGLLVKGTMFCHGIGANINMLWEFGTLITGLQESGDAAFLLQLKNAGYDLDFIKNQSFWRAKQFTLWTLDWDNLNATRIYDSDEGYSMFAGNFAIGGMLYSQLSTDYAENGGTACQAGWDLCL